MGVRHGVLVPRRLYSCDAGSHPILCHQDERPLALLLPATLRDFAPNDEDPSASSVDVSTQGQRALLVKKIF